MKAKHVLKFIEEQVLFLHSSPTRTGNDKFSIVFMTDDGPQQVTSHSVCHAARIALAVYFQEEE